MKFTIRRKIKINFQEHVVSFFVPQVYNLEVFNNIFSLTFPGYPTKFTINCSGELELDTQFEPKKIINMSLINLSTNFINFLESLTNSIFLENSSVKTLKPINELTKLKTKKNFANTTNPYVLFSFEEYMELKFKRIKINNNFHPLNENCLLKIYFEEIFNFPSQEYFKKVSKTLIICGKKTTKIFLMLMFFEILNSFKTTSNLEILLKLLFKYYSMSIFRKMYKSIIFSQDSMKITSNLYEEKTILEKEFLNVRIFLIGLIRSGNMFSN